ncbi:OmpH family outer membrane protein [Hyphobacterium sp. CCMP332]|uniref:OmpH family outer membrane protein n=1 Tax=Hyphobacterium sp. CCMP332 TaxID=2749086 RepID=UPI00164EFAC1|nr:OmpH family outer membrane protein [Hyphobacterium sp. CCMP332]QNL18667.1 OmpH family outer membrane protein [Hyphobacterium sp. CCMP332]
MKPSSLNPFAIFAAAVTLMAISAPAMAQQTILVINEDQILRESAVGQHIATRLQAISTELDGELRALRTPIDEEAERLNAETAAITQEAIQQRPDLLQRIQTVSQQAQEFEARRQQYSNELVATERAAMRPVLEALQAVLQEVVEDRNADIVIDRGALVYAGQSVDASVDVIERLNARLPTVPVNRVRLPEGDAQQPQQ